VVNILILRNIIGVGDRSGDLTKGDYGFVVVIVVSRRVVNDSPWLILSSASS
jgi:hypothetical protein